MIAKIKSLTNSEDKKRLISNFFSLSFLQGANYILPLITLPYLVRVLGVEYIGLLAFATATIAYFGILTDYGFNLSATKEISMHRHDKTKITEIFSSVMMIKITLMLVSFIILSILILSFEKFRNDALIYFLSFGIVIGQVLFPIWFFQGMERMKYITYLNILSKSIFTVAIFLFVQDQSDFYLVPLLTSIGAIVAAIWSHVLIRKEFGIGFKMQDPKILKVYLVDGWHLFLSRIYVSTYTTANILLLGIFTNNTAVGHYSIAEKIVVAIAGLFEPVNQTIYPYLARKYKENFSQFVQLLKKIATILFAFSFSFVLISEYFREEFVYIVSGKYNSEVIVLLTILLIRILTYPFGAFFSNAMIIMHKKREYMKAMNATVILDLVLVPPSIYFFEAIGLAYAFLTVLIIHTLLLLYYLLQSIKQESEIL